MKKAINILNYEDECNLFYCHIELEGELSFCGAMYSHGDDNPGCDQIVIYRPHTLRVLKEHEDEIILCKQCVKEYKKSLK